MNYLLLLGSLVLLAAAATTTAEDGPQGPPGDDKYSKEDNYAKPPGYAGSATNKGAFVRRINQFFLIMETATSVVN